MAVLTRYTRRAPWSHALAAFLLWVPLVTQSQSAQQSPAPQYAGLNRPAGREWPISGGDWSNTRYSALTQVNTLNVAKLGLAWISTKFDEGGASRVTPIVRDGLMLVTAGREVYAMSARTGERVWTYNTTPDTPVPGPTTASGAEPNWRGVGVGQGLVFVGLQDGSVVALEERTGEWVWTQQTGADPPKEGQSAATAPLYVNGVVFTGLSNGDNNLRGRLTALDAATGRKLWQRFSIPGPGEPGHGTWPSLNDTWKAGGGGIWTNPAVDPELGLVYFGTGNAVPALAGDWRPGANLYTCSVLAVDVRTGELRWHYQLVHHDLFEGDVGTSVVLYDAQLGGKTRKALAVLRADGYLFSLDRETGKPLLPVRERPVPQMRSQLTSPTQPFPAVGESFLMSCEDWKRERLPAGFRLGCMWTPPASPPPSNDPQNVLAPFPSVRIQPMAYSPQTGYFYAQGISMLEWPRRSQDPYFLRLYFTYPDAQAYGELAAIDGRTGKIAWKRRTPPGFFNGGALATAGGLLFRSAADGNVEAYDARTGDVLWRFQTGIVRGSGPLVSYEMEGEQYVALSLGSAVWAFRLGGKNATATAPAIPTWEEQVASPVVDTREIDTTSVDRTGMRYFVDEYAFTPYRARVHAGDTMLFVNNGSVRHEIVALDGSWGTGPLSPTQEASVRFSQPGVYTYRCKEHPWAYGRILVEPYGQSDSRGTGITASPATDPDGIAEQAMRGRARYNKDCSACHGEDLGGRAPAPALSGSTFLSHWKHATVGELLDRIRTTMPQARPGSLDRTAYLDIVAYLLRANDIVSVSSEIQDDPRSLGGITIETMQ